MMRSLILSTLAALTIFGCFNGTHDFTIRFEDVHGLKTGDPVYFEDSPIGEVAAVEYTDAGLFLVSVALQKEFASAATDASRFYIDADPQKPAQKRVRLVRMAPGGTTIEEGAVVDGHTKYAVLYEQFVHRLGQNITILESGINDFLKALQGISTEEQIAQLERQLDAIIADLGEMSRDMQYRLEHEILPLFREKLEELRKRLEGTAKDEDLDRLERKMEAIDDSLSVYLQRPVEKKKPAPLPGSQNRNMRCALSRQ